MSCSDNDISLYVDGAFLPRPQRFYGCSGEKVRLSATSTLLPPVTYKWSIDAALPIIWTGPYYDYTFDNKAHEIRLTVDSVKCECSKGTTFRTVGRDCIQCATVCSAQAALIPSGRVISLIDETGKIYPIDDAGVGICRDSSNNQASASIKRAIKAVSKCHLPGLKVAMYNNREARTCISLTITNSPIRFRYAVVGTTKFLFDTTFC